MRSGKTLCIAGACAALLAAVPTAWADESPLPMTAADGAAPIVVDALPPARPPAPATLLDRAARLDAGDSYLRDDAAPPSAPYSEGGSWLEGSDPGASGMAPCPRRRPVDWTKVPPVRPIARAGDFQVPPTTPGYFSLLDQARGNYREKPPILPYGTQGDTTAPSYDVDYRYLDDPDNTQHDYLDPLKRIHLNDNWMLSLGGNFRVREMHEVDSRLGTVENDYTLLRTRLHGDLWYRDSFRFFVEGHYCESFDNDLSIGSRDINRGDLLNLFIDLKAAELEDGTLWFRGGRQELNYGSRRMLGSRSWSNSRPTWDGLKTFYIGQKWDADAFWVEPVVVNRNDFDEPDTQQNMYGLWLTRKIRKGTTFELYFLDYDDALPTAATGLDGTPGQFNVQTYGSRISGDKEHWLWDLESMLQTGTWSDQDKLAGAVASGLGYEFAALPGQPQVWGGYDWASGTEHPGEGSTNQTFYQISPAVHYYFGAMDLVGRENIRDLHGQILFYPENWITTIIEFHHFELDSPYDALYNAQGTATRHDATGAAGRDVGNEFDMHVHMHLATHSNVQVGWSKLFAGSFIAATGPNVSPELFYVQYNYRW